MAHIESRTWEAEVEGPGGPGQVGSIGRPCLRQTNKPNRPLEDSSVNQTLTWRACWLESHPEAGSSLIISALGMQETCRPLQPNGQPTESTGKSCFKKTWRMIPEERHLSNPVASTYIHMHVCMCPHTFICMYTCVHTHNQTHTLLTCSLLHTCTVGVLLMTKDSLEDISPSE